MELTLAAPEASPAELAALDEALAGLLAPSAGEGRAVSSAHPKRRHLLAGLHALRHARGYVSAAGLAELCRRLEVPYADAYGVASFYALFPTTPRPPVAIHLCDDLACAARSAPLAAALRERLGEPLGEDSPGPEEPSPGGPSAEEPSPLYWASSPCLGRCEAAPAALVTVAGEGEAALAPVSEADLLALLDRLSSPSSRAGHTTPAGDRAAGDHTAGATPPGLLATLAAPPLPRVGALGPALLSARIGVVDPTSLADYRRHGGYEALARALAGAPEAVVEAVRAAKLTGRGGAGFPSATKWEAVAAAPGEHYLVCNADESEPGTFKDRVLLEGDPFSILEAITIAAYATRSSAAYVYLRGEYPLARARLADAIEAATDAGLLGANVAGSGFSLRVGLVSGAGAYICGEETALLNSIEGFRGEPRAKPPFPTEVGLFARPTAINNVETLANLLPILTDPATYMATGTMASPGTRLYCVSGAVPRPGVYEVAQGTTLAALLDAAGAETPPAAVLLGGAAGGFVRGDAEIALSTEGARAASVSLGSGVVLALESVEDVARGCRRIARFFVEESCGQCVPCRVGTVRQAETLARLAEDRPLGSANDELARLAELAQVMRDASICGLGQTAPAAIASAIATFGPEILRGGVSPNEHGGAR